MVAFNSSDSYSSNQTLQNFSLPWADRFFLSAQKGIFDNSATDIAFALRLRWDPDRFGSKLSRQEAEEIYAEKGVRLPADVRDDQYSRSQILMMRERDRQNAIDRENIYSSADGILARMGLAGAEVLGGTLNIIDGPMMFFAPSRYFSVGRKLEQISRAHNVSRSTRVMAGVGLNAGNALTTSIMSETPRAWANTYTSDPNYTADTYLKNVLTNTVLGTSVSSIGNVAGAFGRRGGSAHLNAQEHVPGAVNGMPNVHSEAPVSVRPDAYTGVVPDVLVHVRPDTLVGPTRPTAVRTDAHIEVSPHVPVHVRPDGDVSPTERGWTDADILQGNVNFHPDRLTSDIPFNAYTNAVQGGVDGRWLNVNKRNYYHLFELLNAKKTASAGMQQGIVRYINSLNGEVLHSQLKLVNQVLGEIKTRFPRGRVANFTRPAAGSGKGGSLSLEAQALINAVNRRGVRPEQIGDVLLAYQRSPNLTKPNLRPNTRVGAMNDAIKNINVQGIPSKLSEAASAVREFNSRRGTRMQGSHKARSAALKLRRLRESRSSQGRVGLRQGLSNFNYAGGQGGNSSASPFSWSRSRRSAFRAGFKEVAQVAADAVPAIAKQGTTLPGRVLILLAASAAKSASRRSRAVQELQAEISGVSSSDVQKGIVLVKKRVEALREQALGV